MEQDMWPDVPHSKKKSRGQCFRQNLLFLNAFTNCLSLSPPFLYQGLISLKKAVIRIHDLKSCPTLWNPNIKILLTECLCPPNSYADALIPPCNSIGNGDFKEVIRLNDVIRVGCWSHRTGPLLRSWRGTRVLPPCEDTVRGCTLSERDLSPETTLLEVWS